MSASSCVNEDLSLAHCRFVRQFLNSRLSCASWLVMAGRGEAKSSAIGPKLQSLVFLDVGGTSFKIAKSTLARYPDCLLSKMVNEFPDLV